MLDRVANIYGDTVTIVVYVESPTLEYLVMDMLKKRFKSHVDSVFNLDSVKKVMDAKTETYVAPLRGGKWLLNINTDKLSKQDIAKTLSVNTSFGVAVYWVHKYATFKWMTSLDTIKKQGVYASNYYFGKLFPSDIRFLYNNIVGDKTKLNKDLLDYVVDTYTYDVQSVCDLFMAVKSGSEIVSKKDIIELIGVGGNSVDSFTLGLLTSSVNSDKGKKTSISRNLKLLKDLSYTYKYSTIRNYMLSTIEGFMEMKQLQVMGYYCKFDPDIPDCFDSKRLSRLKRFKGRVLEQLTIPNLLNLKICLSSFNNYDSEVAVVQAVISYLDNVQRGA